MAPTPRLLLLGATGDLAGRFLLPALARLHDAGRLPPGLQVLAAGPQAWDDAAFREHARARLEGLVPEPAQRALLAALSYRRVDLTDPATLASVVVGPGPLSVYLALPPALFPVALAGLADCALPPGSRVAVEKPFGEDLAGAQRLNALLARLPGAYRVDHVLAMPTVQDLAGLRAPGGPLAPRVDGAGLARVDVLWEETLALEGRADFYDRAGAVRDVVQNHLLQVLALVAMEPPTGGRDLADRKVEALRAARVVGPGVRGRYTAGRLAGGAPVPDYAQERGVDPARGTETFAELVLEVDLPRWAGTRFVLRAGKALEADRKGVLLHLRAPLDRAGQGPADPVWLELDGPGDTDRPDGELAAYVEVLGELLSGGSDRSVRGDEAEQAWRVVEPVLAQWAAGAAPLRDYPAGTAGPG